MRITTYLHLFLFGRFRSLLFRSVSISHILQTAHTEAHTLRSSFMTYHAHQRYYKNLADQWLSGWLSDSALQLMDTRRCKFNAHSRCTPAAMWAAWAANSCDSCHVAVLSRLFTDRGGAYANSAFHSSGVGKWEPASPGKPKAGMAHSICE